MIACHDEFAYLFLARYAEGHAGIHASSCCATLLVYRAHERISLLFCPRQKGMGLSKQ